MISLRKHIDNYLGEQVESGKGEADSSGPRTSETTMSAVVLAEFSAMLLAIGQCADRAVPSLGVELSQKMTGLQKTLVLPITTDRLTGANQEAQNELSQWADRAASHHRDIERELGEIISVVSATAQSTNERDQKYAKEIGDLTGRLGSIAEENDLAHVRRSIMESTRALKACVARMAEDSKVAVHQLTAQVKEYRTRLDEAEKTSNTDMLTNLANRRAFEKHLAARVDDRKAFCLIMCDLDDFKAVNDRFGHIAGDDLLKQFAAELKSQFSPGEMVARLGGDEFVAVVPGGLSDAEPRVERVRKWALGEYKISTGDHHVKTPLAASIGVAAWDGKESGIALLARADQDVYRAKQTGGRARASVRETRPRSTAPAENKASDFPHLIR